jgi:diacylglycerol kinase family enzyme
LHPAGPIQEVVRVKVTLFHNEAAGEGASREDLLQIIERHGHSVVNVVATTDDASHILQIESDLAVASGGDGTVSSAARVLAGKSTPLAILPNGTANNIARSLGITGTTDEIVGRWSGAARRPLDLGSASGPWGERWFIEAVGGGLIARSIAAFEQQPASEDRPKREELIDAVRMHTEVLSTLEPCAWNMTLDGEAVSGDFLLVAVLNIRFIGPNLELCPGADPTDGHFAVVMAEERHRDALVRHLQHREAEQEVGLGVKCRRVRRVEIEKGDLLHIDDAVFTWPPGGRVSMRIEPAALQVLV